MQEDRKDCKKNIHAEEEHITAAWTKQQDEEEDPGIRPKKKRKADRSSEECDARRSERLQEEHHTC